MNGESKSGRLKQVQFRMPPNVHKELRKILIDTDMSMADLFNKTAVEYIENYKIKRSCTVNEK